MVATHAPHFIAWEPRADGARAVCGERTWRRVGLALVAGGRGLELEPVEIGEASGTPAGEVEPRPGKATASGWGLVAWVASVRGCGIDPSPSFADKRNARSVQFLHSPCPLFPGGRGMAAASGFPWSAWRRSTVRAYEGCVWFCDLE